ncbi:hypothetical protein SBOR_4574 [Sclerotinia borealis F-4128]|uniref:Uncharacterized protein n=1 Tax=Sclerotinia borealis (strain F-4128) TaxID=1432307 RepID=W9CGP7_SCLBF|nr:hypothetical protein SBOR_4574 [Sclerotinia borealis F-4128]
MGITHSTARYIAPLSFLIDFAAQQYGMLSTPNMKDIHDAHLSFWSPQPYAIALFFFPQQIFQLVWLYRLWKLDAGKSVQEKEEVAWMIFWNSASLKTANVFVLINSLTQLYFIFLRQPPMNTQSTSSVLTHIVSKTFAGIGVLDLLHNGSVAYFDHQGPSMAVKVLTGVGFGLLSSNSDWIFGGCLVYDLLALAVGQRQIGATTWSNLLGVYAVGTAGLVGLRNYAKPPYISKMDGYEPAPSDDEDIVV